jgi:uncharacterized protein YdaU (DUF1376 family)
MNKPPAFQFYASDFLVDTSAWTPEEIGVYVRMLALEWVNGSVPQCSAERPNRLALVCGVSEKCLRRVWGQVGTKFVVGDDGNLRNLRLEQEREKQAAYRDEKSKAGIAGAQKRWKPASTIKQPDGTAMILPIAEGMAKNSSSSSSSSSSSFSEKEKEKAACSVSKNLPTISKEQERLNAERVWAQLEETPEGKAVLEGFKFRV